MKVQSCVVTIQLASELVSECPFETRAPTTVLRTVVSQLSLNYEVLHPILLYPYAAASKGGQIKCGGVESLDVGTTEQVLVCSAR